MTLRVVGSGVSAFRVVEGAFALWLPLLRLLVADVDRQKGDVVLFHISLRTAQESTRRN